MFTYLLNTGNMLTLKAFRVNTLFFLLLCFVGACSSNTSDKFLGEWKSADFKEPVSIKRTGENYILTQKGQPELLATYDADAKRLMIDAGSARVPVIYLADTDEILMSSAVRSTRFSRVK
jgi:hypothetical protein